MPTAMQSDMNSLQLFNFNTEFGWNEIEANLLGASGIITGNTPVSFIRNSLDKYLMAFQEPVGQDEASRIGKTPSPRTKTCADKDGRIVPCDSPERIEGGRSGISLRSILGLPELPPDAAILCSDCTPEQLEELRRTGTVSGTGGSELFKSPFGDTSDLQKKIFLLALGFGLIILSVYLLTK